MKERRFYIVPKYLSILCIVAWLSCSKEEAPAPLLDSLIGTWKHTSMVVLGGFASEYTYSVYTFNVDGTFHYKRWSDNLGLITELDEHDGTWELSDNRLTIKVDGRADLVYEITFTSESVIMTDVKTPWVEKEFEFQEPA